MMEIWLQRGYLEILPDLILQNYRKNETKRDWNINIKTTSILIYL